MCPGCSPVSCARLVERRLLGYQLEGWAEEEARPLPRRAMRLPRARGGPLVVCLDTSHSMAGGRELLAKAVVLEAVSIYIYTSCGLSPRVRERLWPSRREAVTTRACKQVCMCTAALTTCNR